MQPFAIWDSARDVWETPQTEGFFCEHLDVFLATFPTSGMTVNGAAYELPTWEPVTDGSAYSSLLPTVTTQDGANNGGPSQFDRNTPPLNTRVLMLETPTAALSGGVQTLEVQVGGRQKFKTLPTPTVSDTNGPGAHGMGGLDLRTTVSLLPTPMANPTGRSPEAHLAMRQDMGRTGAADLGAAVSLLPTPNAQLGEHRRDNGQDPEKRRAGGHGPTLADEVEHLLPTPQAHDAQKGKTAEQVAAMRARGHGVANLNETVENRLLPTPTVGMMLGGSQTRSGDRSGEMLLPGVAKQIGESTPQPSDAGNAPLDGQLRGQLNLLDAITDTD